MKTTNTLGNVSLGSNLFGDIQLDKLKLIDGKKDWESNWMINEEHLASFIKFSTAAGFKFSDFVLINLYTTMLMDRIPKSSVKNTVEDLRLIINISKKEESELVKHGFKHSKSLQKIYKKLMKNYFVDVNKQKGIVIKGSKKSGLTGRDFVVMFLDAILEYNVTKEDVRDELTESFKKRTWDVFIYNYFIALYRGYDDVLNMVKEYGETVNEIDKLVIQELCMLDMRIFLKNIDSNDFDNIGLNLGIGVIDNEKEQLQMEKDFYTEKYLEELDRINKLEEDIKELHNELQCYEDVHKNKLKGKRVLLIGDGGKESEYKEVIDSLGGEMVMYDSFEDFSKITNAVLDGFDCIVHFTYYTSHSISNKLNKYSNNVLFVNSSSKLELEKALVLR